MRTLLQHRRGKLLLILIGYILYSPTLQIAAARVLG